MTKFASLVVLSFNRASYMKRSVESLWANTTLPYQLIVMDDASDEETQDLVYSWVRQKRVSTALFNVDHNMGLGVAINRAAQISQGEYFCKLDSDLDYTPGWLEHVETLLDAHSEIGCLGLFKYEHPPCRFKDKLIADHGDYYEVEDFVGSALCMRREVYDLCGPWIETLGSFSEDVQFKIAVQQCGYVMALPKTDLVHNYGFGEQHSSLIKVIDWEGGHHEYNIPNCRTFLL